MNITNILTLSSALQDLVEGGRHGRVVDLSTIVSGIQDDEPIIGVEALEFSREAKSHPERYRPLVNMAVNLLRSAGIDRPQVIDLGCGPAILSSMLAQELPTATVTGVDVSEDMLGFAQQTAEAFGVADRFVLHQQDMRLVAGNAPALADLVVSRNMLHRVDGLAEALAQLVRAAKPHGGMACVAAFRQVSDLDPNGQAAFVRAVQERQGEEHLTRAFVRAHLSAPTLSQYQAAARTVAAQLDVSEMRVWAGRYNNVGMFFRR